jgi:DNA segregation ATPase FtsK/SpoIIIE-like protein
MATRIDTTAVVSATRNLPMTMTGEVERLGYSILRGLDRLGFVHTDQDGAIFSVQFDRVQLYGATWAEYHLDAERLWHFSVVDLVKPSVLAQLAAVTKKPVRSFDDGGLAYVVELQPRQKVRLPDRVTLDLAQRPDGDLLVPIGVGSDGAVWRGLADIGHILIVGTTGSGKSTWLHSALASLLTSCGPDRLRLALIDPKRSEFTAWAGVPHLMADIANTEAQAGKLLAELVTEIDRRGDLMAGAFCRDVGAYNHKAADPLPYILCVIDECLDLVLASGKSDLAGHLKTIAIRGRSAGVILWAATQHAAAITGMPRVVNVNLSSRLVFRVADPSAALAAGCPGAETLPRDKPGRMLANLDGTPQVLQGFYLSDEDLEKITRALCVSVPGAGKSMTQQQTITKAQAELVRVSLDKLGGAFIVNKLAKIAPGWTSHKVKVLAQDWQARGWLTVPTSATSPRRVTPELVQMASEAIGQTSQDGVLQTAEAEAMALDSEYNAR